MWVIGVLPVPPGLEANGVLPGNRPEIESVTQHEFPSSSSSTDEEDTADALDKPEQGAREYPPAPETALSERTEAVSATQPGPADPTDGDDLLAEPEPASGERLPPMRLLGIRLRRAGQVFFFPDEEHTVRVGSKVVVELEQGPTLGEVESIAYGLHPPEEGAEGAAPAGRVVGLATAQDIALHAENSILAAEATAFCKTCIRQRGLEMKLVDVEVLHDRSKIIFFFTAPSRIDFRELVKDLVRNYRTRIELRQIGVRHETQMVGGLGNCGMVCCCHRYLRKFAPVTIKMAKEQNLFLNPAKLSGMCGRLLCCLSFEQSNYEEFNRRCPKLGKKYATSKGPVKVLRANLFSQSICIVSDSGEESELTLEQWEALEPRRAEPQGPEQQRALAARGENRPQDNRQRGRQRDAGPGSENTGQLRDRPVEGDEAPLLQDEEAPSFEHDPERQARSRRRRRPPGE